MELLVSRYWVPPLDPMFGPVSIERTGAIDEGLEVDVWAIRHTTTRCFSRDGEWDMEPLPSSRTDEWLGAHRFTLEEAKALAPEAVRTLYSVFGLTLPSTRTGGS